MVTDSRSRAGGEGGAQDCDFDFQNTCNHVLALTFFYIFFIFSVSVPHTGCISQLIRNKYPLGSICKLPFTTRRATKKAQTCLLANQLFLSKS